MIRLILIIIPIAMMCSCEGNFPHNIEDPKSSTSVADLELPRDTIIVAYDINEDRDTTMLIIEDNLIVGKLEDDSDRMFGFFLLGLLFMLGVLLIIGAILE